MAAAALLGLLAAVVALASTPVMNGYRDQAYGGGAFRPTSEKPQSKLWYTDGSWFTGLWVDPAGVVNPQYRIHRLNQATHAWVDMGVSVDLRQKTHADYLWAEGTKTLWVASAVTPAPGQTGDATKIFKYSYSTVTKTYTAAAGYPKDIPGTASTSVPAFEGGAIAVTLALDSDGTLWAAWAKNSDVLSSRSTDLGDTWSAPVKVPVQTNPIRPNGGDGDLAAVISFGNKIGIMWSDHDGLPSPSDDGFYFAVIAAGADPMVAANWSLEELPTLVPGADPREVADDHINLKVAGDGTLYMVGKTGKDTAGCAPTSNSR